MQSKHLLLADIGLGLPQPRLGLPQLSAETLQSAEVRVVGAVELGQEVFGVALLLRQLPLVPLPHAEPLRDRDPAIIVLE